MSVVGSKGIALIDRIKWRVIKAPTRDFRVGPGGTVVKRMRERSIVIPQVSVKGVRLAPSQLSEGTFRSLALIFNLLSSKSELVLLEEPEVCVHHGLLSSLVEIIKTCAAKKQVIFSTHSDFILDSLDPENVLLVHYGPDAGTTARRLPEAIATREFASLKTYLRETGNLGEYWRQKGFA
jgi:hypothetical protein